jgi:hypothetical protein
MYTFGSLRFCIATFISIKNRHLSPIQFRNQYDNDVTTWSPLGRLHQVEYAMEAVKQGSATVGLKSKTHTVLVALKRAASDLAAHQKKILPIDDHIGISIAGLTADARILRQASIPTTFKFLRCHTKIEIYSVGYRFISGKRSCFANSLTILSHVYLLWCAE